MAYFNNLTVGGTTRFLQDVKWPGLKSSVDELNYLHTETTVIDGFLITRTSGESGSIDGWINGSEPLGLKVGNTYTLTFENEDGSFIEENIVATDMSSDTGISGAIGLDSVEMDDIIFMDNVHFDWYGATHLAGDCTWVYLPGFDLISIKIEGLDKNGNKLTHTKSQSNIIPSKHFDTYTSLSDPNGIIEAPTDEFELPLASAIPTGSGLNYLPIHLGLIPGEKYILYITDKENGDTQEAEFICTLFDVPADPEGKTAVAVPCLPLTDTFPYILDDISLVSMKQWNGATILGGGPGCGILSYIDPELTEITICGPGLTEKYYLNNHIPTGITGPAGGIIGLELNGYELQDKIETLVGQEGTRPYSEIFNDYTNNIANGDYSHAEGHQTKTGGLGAHAEGQGTHAVGSESHAEGYYTVAYGPESHAEGSGGGTSLNPSSASEALDYWKTYKFSMSYGGSSHVEGSDNLALGQHSHVGGRSSYNRTYDGFSHGYMLSGGTADSQYLQTVFGRRNAPFAGTTNDYNSSDGTLFIIGNGTSSAYTNAFRVTTAGQVMGSQSFTASGADYAEYYEWADGNPDNEDRRGKFVTYDDGDKIRIANNNDDYILGVISSHPAVIGNGFTDEWQGLYLTDVYGKRLTETVEVEEQEIKDKEGNVIETIPAHTETHFIPNPDYNPEKEYIGRDQRKEWAAVGTHGQLVLIDNGLCEVNSYCTVGKDGTAIPTEKSEYRVIARLDDTHIRIVIK